jgi:hypothetical protein
MVLRVVAPVTSTVVDPFTEEIIYLERDVVVLCDGKGNNYSSCACDRDGGEDVYGHGQQPAPVPQVPGQCPSRRRSSISNAMLSSFVMARVTITRLALAPCELSPLPEAGFKAPTEVVKPSCACDRDGGEDVYGHGQQPAPVPQVTLTERIYPMLLHQVGS